MRDEFAALIHQEFRVDRMGAITQALRQPWHEGIFDLFARQLTRAED
jgi:hypothetical protein